jgi:response regulator RpfG family c-di-GMP phosphodiesterase
MTEKILFVDDEQAVLDGYRRGVGRKYTIECALGGEEALALFAESGPFAVVVSDMHMTPMNGLQLLSRVRGLSPDTVRIMLTGADRKLAMDAVNEGNVFRFLTKPCPPESLDLALQAGLAQYRLVTAEKAMLSGTLMGAVKILTDVLATVRPVAFGRTTRVRDFARRLGKELVPQQVWRVELAALLSQMGSIAIPEEVLTNAYLGRRLVPRDAKLFEEHPRAGYDLVKNVPRLEPVARIILLQEKRFDGLGFPDEDVAGENIPIESRILKVALALDSLTLAGQNLSEALNTLVSREGAYDEAVLDAVRRWTAVDVVQSLLSVGA